MSSELFRHPSGFMSFPIPCSHCLSRWQMRFCISLSLGYCEFRSEAIYAIHYCTFISWKFLLTNPFVADFRSWHTDSLTVELVYLILKRLLILWQCSCPSITDCTTETVHFKGADGPLSNVDCRCAALHWLPVRSWRNRSQHCAARSILWDERDVEMLVAMLRNFWRNQHSDKLSCT